MSTVRRLPPDRHPVAVEFRIPDLPEVVDSAEAELRSGALEDRDRCRGYFPSLAGTNGIVTDLPASASFAARFPRIVCSGVTHRFNFLRLSLAQQSLIPEFHLDSDADTAITGEVSSLGHRQIRRVLLNLSEHGGRALHYLDVDPWSIGLEADGSYVRVVDAAGLRDRTRVVTIPRRSGPTVHGLAFASNLVLHSGVDDAHGHFVAAYGIDVNASSGSPSSKGDPANAARRRSRSSRCRATVAPRSP